MYSCVKLDCLSLCSGSDRGSGRIRLPVQVWKEIGVSYRTPIFVSTDNKVTGSVEPNSWTLICTACPPEGYNSGEEEALSETHLDSTKPISSSSSAKSHQASIKSCVGSELSKLSSSTLSSVFQADVAAVVGKKKKKKKGKASKQIGLVSNPNDEDDENDEEEIKQELKTSFFEAQSEKVQEGETRQLTAPLGNEEKDRISPLLVTQIEIKEETQGNEKEEEEEENPEAEGDIKDSHDVSDLPQSATTDKKKTNKKNKKGKKAKKLSDQDPSNSSSNIDQNLNPSSSSNLDSPYSSARPSLTCHVDPLVFLLNSSRGLGLFNCNSDLLANNVASDFPSGSNLDRDVLVDSKILNAEIASSLSSSLLPAFRSDSSCQHLVGSSNSAYCITVAPHVGKIVQAYFVEIQAPAVVATHLPHLRSKLHQLLVQPGAFIRLSRDILVRVARVSQNSPSVLSSIDDSSSCSASHSTSFVASLTDESKPEFQLTSLPVPSSQSLFRITAATSLKVVSV
mmetsp:Transcript_16058/g.28883  ORF Transcript_16058/g.28883 Transcript_16058/m.28883 type:complete len:510 (-) Transcript_16058:67-1596(-)